MTNANNILAYPFISRSGRHYIHFAFSNKILEVDSNVFNFFQNIKKLNKIELLQVKQDIQKIQKENSLASDKILKFVFPLNNLEHQLNSKLEHLILNVSEDCNLRCKYCEFSGNYIYERHHSSKLMEDEIAFKAIDFFLSRRNEDAKSVYLSFYGGEPLLNFPLIAKVIDYVNKRRINNIKFCVTTNGTLLSNKISNFFISNNVYIRISLDGPKNIHDKNRIFKNSKGSYERIVNNLNALYNKNHEYYISHIGFTPVVSNYSNLLNIEKWFKNWKYSTPNILSNFIDVSDSNIVYFYPIKNLKKEYNKLSEFYDMNYWSLIKENTFNSNISFNYIGKTLIRILNRVKCKVKDNIYPNGICLPGQRRLFVNTNGDFSICEKINNKINIGSIHSGFDYEKIENLINDYCSISINDCKDCWAIRLCSLCFVSVFRGDRLDIDKKREYCKAERQHLSSSLKLYASIIEDKKELLLTLNKQIIH